MNLESSLEDLWQSAPQSEGIFNPAEISGLPAPARRYLEHAIAPGTRLASAVRLRMHGHIKLGGWHPFSAKQVINWSRGMIWCAAVRLYGLPIHGSDSFVESGTMRWRLFGVLPLINAGGPDITRSAAGRVNIESIWLPAVLCANEILWTAPDASHAHAHFTAHGEKANVVCTVDKTGKLRAVSMPRWGNPSGSKFEYHNFGGSVEQEGTFDGYTIPTRLRVGWHFHTDGFAADGEFFRVTVDDAVYR
jgi:hypothetical protein